MDDPIRVHDCPCCTCSPKTDQRPLLERLDLTTKQYARCLEQMTQQARETVAAARAVLDEDQRLRQLRQRRTR